MKGWERVNGQVEAGERGEGWRRLGIVIRRGERPALSSFFDGRPSSTRQAQLSAPPGTLTALLHHLPLHRFVVHACAGPNPSAAPSTLLPPSPFFDFFPSVAPPRCYSSTSCSVFFLALRAQVITQVNTTHPASITLLPAQTLIVCADATQIH